MLPNKKPKSLPLLFPEISETKALPMILAKTAAARPWGIFLSIPPPSQAH